MEQNFKVARAGPVCRSRLKPSSASFFTPEAELQGALESVLSLPWWQRPARTVLEGWIRTESIRNDRGLGQGTRGCSERSLCRLKPLADKILTLFPLSWLLVSAYALSVTHQVTDSRSSLAVPGFCGSGVKEGCSKGKAPLPVFPWQWNTH
jgi:hypothetical protein